MKYYNFRAMNTDILLAADGEYATLKRAFEQVEALVRQHEDRFTRFSEESELSALNQSAGLWFPASDAMYELVSLAYDLYEDTGGLFNPGILSALESLGYNRSMEAIRTDGSTAPVIEYWARPAPVFSRVDFDPRRRAIRLPAGLRIDLGGIAKGWIAEQAARLLNRYSPACLVDCGGDMFACGMPEGAESWSVALEDPLDASQALAVLSMQPGAVATSTITKRHWKQGDQERHHLIDPRTGLPADAFWVSVSVVAPHAAQAEVLAKSLLIGGPDAASMLTRCHPQAAFVAVDRNRKIWGSENSQKVLYGNLQETK